MFYRTIITLLIIELKIISYNKTLIKFSIFDVLIANILCELVIL